MRQTDADRVLGVLVGATGGWHEVIADEFLLTIAAWDDVDAAERAVSRFTRPPGRNRPTLVQLIDAYREEEQRRVPSGGRVVPFADGIRIAWDAYQAEARRTGREPNRALFEKYLGNLRPGT